MSVQAISWVLDHSEAALGTRLVAISVANHADKYGRQARASVASYAAEAHLSQRQAHRALKDLEAMGELRRTGKFGARADRLVVVYEFPALVDGVPNLPPVEPDDLTNPTERGDIHDVHGVTPMSEKPSLEPSLNQRLFIEWWPTYPKRVEKRSAQLAFERALKRASFDEILAGTIRYRDKPDRRKEFTKNPTTWLNGDCWLDEAETAAAPDASRSFHVADDDPPPLEDFAEAVAANPWSKRANA